MWVRGQWRDRYGSRQCKLFGEECESVVHVFWECPMYDTTRNTFMGKLKNLLGSFEEFSALDNVEKMGFVLGQRRLEEHHVRTENSM